MADLIETAPDILTPAFDAGSLEATAKAIRASIDPCNPRSIYFGRHEDAKAARAAAEARITAAYLRSGLQAPQPETPQQVAERQHREAFGMTQHPNLVEMLDNHRTALETANSPARLQEMATALRQELGPANYDAMVAQARHATDAEIPAAVLADKLLLRNKAGWGKYKLAAAATKPRN